jgi:hypothetical protein
MSVRLPLAIAASILAVMGLITIGTVDADSEDEFVEGGFTFIVTSGGLTVTLYDSSVGGPFCDIPSVVTHDGVDYPVTHISAFSFYDNDTLTVQIPKSVLSIESLSFMSPSIVSISVSDENTEFCSLDGILYDKGMNKLIAYPKANPEDQYYMPHTVVMMEDHVLESCLNLQEVWINASIKVIPKFAFAGCSNLQYINAVSGINYLPSSLKVIDVGAFYDCPKLESIVLPDNLLSIGADAFSGTGIKTVTIPENLTYISGSSFSKCGELEQFESNNPNFVAKNGVLYEKMEYRYSLLSYPCGCKEKVFNIPSYVTYLEPRSFTGCVYLEEVRFSSGLSSVSQDSFYSCKSLKKVILSNDILVLDSYCFGDCQNLTEIEFGDRIAGIGPYALYNTGFTSITFPESVSLLDEYCLMGCQKLETVYISGETVELEIGAFMECKALKDIWLTGTEITFSDGSLNIGVIDERCYSTVHVHKGVNVPYDAVTNTNTVITVEIIGERPYPYENLFAAAICVLIVIIIIRAVGNV